MLFVCDIGNSNIKSGFFSEEKISRIKIFEDIDTLSKFLSGRKITGAAVSSVVPGKLKYFKKEFVSLFQHNPYVISRRSDFNLKIDYETPDTLGIDRICSAEGAFHLYCKRNKHYNKNLYIITIDFGTATTINIIRFKGIFTGGLILPGVRMMFKSLRSETAQLPGVIPAEYKNVIGRSTKSSIASGVVNATVGAVVQTINHLKQKDNEAEFKIYATGGNAKYILPYLRINYEYEPGLVLYGIKAVYENNVRKKEF